MIEIGAATLDRKISNFAKDNGIGNLEFFVMYSRFDWRSSNNE